MPEKVESWRCLVIFGSGNFEFNDEPQEFGKLAARTMATFSWTHKAFRE
jgi:hypothetical protein